MVLAPGNWLLSPDGSIYFVTRTMSNDERFADNVDHIETVIRPEDPEYQEWLADLRPWGTETPDGYRFMYIQPPPGICL